MMIIKMLPSSLGETVMFMRQSGKEFSVVLILGVQFIVLRIGSHLGVSDIFQLVCAYHTTDTTYAEAADTHRIIAS